MIHLFVRLSICTCCITLQKLSNFARLCVLSVSAFLVSCPFLLFYAKFSSVQSLTSLVYSRSSIASLGQVLQETTAKQRYNTIQYNTIQYNTIQYNTIQYNTIQYNTIQYNTIQYNTIQYTVLSWVSSFSAFIK